MSKLRERNSINEKVPEGWTAPDDLNVYEFKYRHQVPVRIPDGAGDSNFSHMETVDDVYHVAARSPEFAEVAFVRHYPPSIYQRLSGPVAVLIIDAYVDVGKCWQPNG